MVQVHAPQSLFCFVSLHDAQASMPGCVVSFEGHWRVREHVFDAHGQPLGTVRQRRILESTGPQRFRLTQHCTPDASLNDHPMARFAGTHVFDLQVEGSARRYLGPAVVGTGQMLGDATMWGEGIWPNFGHAFQSYSVRLNNKQLTGGTFSNGNTLMAQIVGIAQPESEKDEWPELSGPYKPSEVAPRWVGTQDILNADGSVKGSHRVERTYTADGCVDQFENGKRTMRINDAAGTLSVQNPRSPSMSSGLSRRCGWSLQLEWVETDGLHVRAFEALEASDGHLVAIHRHYRNLLLAGIEVLQLRPEENHE